jgi:hypothetical protein
VEAAQVRIEKDLEVIVVDETVAQGVQEGQGRRRKEPCHGGKAPRPAAMAAIRQKGFGLDRLVPFRTFHDHALRLSPDLRG